jgi:hypothetical protein
MLLLGAFAGLFMFAASGIGYWIYVFWPMIKRRGRLNELGRFRLALLQIPLVLSLAMFCLGYYEFVFLPISPPAFAITIFGYTLKYSKFLYPITLFSFFVSLIFYFFLTPVFPKLDFWISTIATLIFIGVFFIVADAETNRLQAMAIENQKFDCVSIKSFWFRSRHTNNRSEIEINTTGVKRNTKYIWSFATLDFYEWYRSSSNEPLC